MASFGRMSSVLQRYGTPIAAIGTSVAILLSELPQTVLLSRYRQLLTNYEQDGKPTRVTDEIQSLYYKVCCSVVRP